MNLIQTQYHLRDLPNEQVKAFANGRDPSAVPEWLAAAEMQRRERVEMASSKAPSKSVKERLEETMGLKALQAQRQQMAGQQIGEQAMAAPTIPENVPQPEDQPEVQEAAAGGLMSGIAKLPVEMFHQAAYAGGGIIAFDRGGDIPDVPVVSTPAYAELMKRINEPEETIETPEQLIAKRKALLEQQGVRPAGEGQERRLQERGVAYEQEKKDRALNNLIASMSAFGRPNIQGRGLGSDYANTAVQGFEAGRAEDAKFRDTQDKLQDAIEAQRRAELVGDVDTAQKANQEQKKLKAELFKTKLTASAEGARTEESQRKAGLDYLAADARDKTAREANRLSAAHLARDPDAIRGANALIQDAKKLGKDLTLQEALVIYGQSSAGYMGREAGIDQQKEKLIQDKYEKQRPWSEAIIDMTRKKDSKKADEMEAANRAVMDRLRRDVGGGVSSNQGGSSSGAAAPNTGWGQATKVQK